MRRYIVRFVTSGRDGAKTAIVERLRASPEVVVVEETPKMVLVEADEQVLRQLVPESDDVLVVPERHYERPNRPLSIEKKRK